MTPMTHWQRVWRQGFALTLSRPALAALRRALLLDDPRLVQMHTTLPPALGGAGAHAVQAACALGFCGWQGESLATVDDVNAFFAKTCLAADERLGEPAASRYFLDWFDKTPRHRMRHLLLAEVELALQSRQTIAA